MQTFEDLFLAAVTDSEEATSDACGRDDDAGLDVVDRKLSVKDTRTIDGQKQVKACGRTPHFTDFGVFLEGTCALTAVVWVIVVLSSYLVGKHTGSLL